MSDTTISVKAFSVKVVRLGRAMPRSAEGRALSGELNRLGLKLAQTYLKYIRSHRDQEGPAFLAHARDCLKVLTEILGWLDLVSKANLGWGTRISPLHAECQKLISTFAAIKETPTARNSITRRAAYL